MPHTPGPWHVSRSSAYVRYTQSDGTHPNICDVGTWSATPEELVANARLIAAAPELLDSLQEMKALAEIKFGNLDPDANVLFEKAKVVIRKAKGYPPATANADSHAAHGAGLPTGTGSGSVPTERKLS